MFEGRKITGKERNQSKKPNAGLLNPVSALLILQRF